MNIIETDENKKVIACTIINFIQKELPENYQ